MCASSWRETDNRVLHVRGAAQPLLLPDPGLSPQAIAAAAAEAAATSAQLRRWVDTAADPAYVLLHSRVEGRAGRCGVGACWSRRPEFPCVRPPSVCPLPAPLS
jgi:hypothetical protein